MEKRPAQPDPERGGGRIIKPGLGMTIMATVLSVLTLSLVACGDTATPASPVVEARATPTALPQEPTSTPMVSTSDGWITFTSEADGFAVDMPGEPQTSSQSTDSELGKITFYFFKYLDGEAQYVVSYNDYPLALDELDPERALDDAIAGVGRGNEMENVQRVDVQGNPGIEGETSTQGKHVWYRAILVGNRLYQLIATAPEADHAGLADEARRFIDSFTLLDQ